MQHFTKNLVQFTDLNVEEGTVYSAKYLRDKAITVFTVVP